MSQYLTLEKIESERCYRRKRTGRYMVAILRATHQACVKEQRASREREVRVARERDPRLAAVGWWDRTVLEAIDVLGEMASDARILARLRRQGAQSLTTGSLAFSLKRLMKNGLIRPESRDMRGESVRFWTSVPEGAE